MEDWVELLLAFFGFTCLDPNNIFLPEFIDMMIQVYGKFGRKKAEKMRVPYFQLNGNKIQIFPDVDVGLQSYTKLAKKYKNLKFGTNRNYQAFPFQCYLNLYECFDLTPKENLGRAPLLNDVAKDFFPQFFSAGFDLQTRIPDFTFTGSYLHFQKPKAGEVFFAQDLYDLAFSDSCQFLRVAGENPLIFFDSYVGYNAEELMDLFLSFPDCWDHFSNCFTSDPKRISRNKQKVLEHRIRILKRVLEYWDVKRPEFSNCFREFLKEKNTSIEVLMKKVRVPLTFRKTTNVVIAKKLKVEKSEGSGIVNSDLEDKRELALKISLQTLNSLPDPFRYTLNFDGTIQETTRNFPPVIELGSHSVKEDLQETEGFPNLEEGFKEFLKEEKKEKCNEDETVIASQHEEERQSKVSDESGQSFKDASDIIAEGTEEEAVKKPTVEDSSVQMGKTELKSLRSSKETEPVSSDDEFDSTLDDEDISLLNEPLEGFLKRVDDMTGASKPKVDRTHLNLLVKRYEELMATKPRALIVQHNWEIDTALRPKNWKSMFSETEEKPQWYYDWKNFISARNEISKAISDEEERLGINKPGEDLDEDNFGYQDSYISDTVSKETPETAPSKQKESPPPTMPLKKLSSDAKGIYRPPIPIEKQSKWASDISLPPKGKIEATKKKSEKKEKKNLTTKEGRFLVEDALSADRIRIEAEKVYSQLKSSVELKFRKEGKTQLNFDEFSLLLESNSVKPTEETDWVEEKKKKKALDNILEKQEDEQSEKDRSRSSSGASVVFSAQDLKRMREAAFDRKYNKIHADVKSFINQRRANQTEFSDFPNMCYAKALNSIVSPFGITCEDLYNDNQQHDLLEYWHDLSSKFDLFEFTNLFFVTRTCMICQNVCVQWDVSTILSQQEFAKTNQKLVKQCELCKENTEHIQITEIMQSNFTLWYDSELGLHKDSEGYVNEKSEVKYVGKKVGGIHYKGTGYGGHYDNREKHNFCVVTMQDSLLPQFFFQKCIKEGLHPEAAAFREGFRLDKLENTDINRCLGLSNKPDEWDRKFLAAHNFIFQGVHFGADSLSHKNIILRLKEAVQLASEHAKVLSCELLNPQRIMEIKIEKGLEMGNFDQEEVGEMQGEVQKKEAPQQKPRYELRSRKMIAEAMRKEEEEKEKKEEELLKSFITNNKEVQEETLDQSDEELKELLLTLGRKNEIEKVEEEKDDLKKETSCAGILNSENMKFLFPPEDFVPDYVFKEKKEEENKEILLKERKKNIKNIRKSRKSKK